LFFIPCNKNVDIKFSAHDAFLELPSSGTLKVGRLENLIILKVLGASKPKGLNSIVTYNLFFKEKKIKKEERLIFEPFPIPNYFY